VSVAARASAVAALALVSGVGTVYAPVPTFTAIAVLFALGLWAFVQSLLFDSWPLEAKLLFTIRPSTSCAW
jgi:hypothetical protein